MKLSKIESGNREGPLFVFLHGGGVASWMWKNQVNYFTDYHCVTIDLPGHGKSIMQQKFVIKDIATEVLKIIEALRQDKEVIICGFSIGAQVVLQILSHSHTIDYAIINSALTRPQKLLNILTKVLLPLSFPLAKTKRFSKAQARALLIPEENFELYFRDTTSLTYRILQQTLVENMLFTLPKSLTSSPTNTLILVGEKERKMMKQSALDLTRTMDQATGVIIPKVGHGLPYAKPDLFNELVHTWLTTGEISQAVKTLVP